jgi:hypothetical protein
MPTYNGWTIVTMPTTPWPAGIEVATNALVAANTNPFTAQQQFQDWNATFDELSVSLPPLTQTQAASWITFLRSCRGPMRVFQFPAGLAAAFPESLTSDGSTQRYWRLKSTQSKWSVKLAAIFGITFEVREAT